VIKTNKRHSPQPWPLIYIVVDPKSINTVTVKDPLRLQGLTEIFKLVAMKNGRLVTDSDGEILNEIISNIKKLPPSGNDRLKLYATETAKKERWDRIVNYEMEIEDDVIENILNLFYQTKSDMIVTSNQNKDKFERKVPEPWHVLLYKDVNSGKNYAINYAEKFIIDGFPISYITEKTSFRIFISRLARFTNSLSFFDPQIGHPNNDGEPNKESFWQWEKSFQDIIDYWEWGSLVLDKSVGEKAHVKIITKDYSYVMTRSYLGHKEWYDEKYKIKKEYKELESETIYNFQQKMYNAIVKEIIQPLYEKYSFWCNFSLEIKDDRYNSFRNRYLLTDQCALQFDKGFSLYDNSKRYRDNHINFYNNDDDKIGKILDLDTINYYNTLTN